MKKNKKIISLTAAAALLCVGGAFALNANTTVSADTNPVATESQQIMLGASVLLDGVVDTGDDTGIIRFPVIVRDEVKKQIVESKIYVLPQASWEKETPPTPQEIMGHAEKFEGITKNQEGSIDKWVDYYEDIKPYDSDYEQAVVYMKNIPMEQFASAFHVCSWMKLSDGTTVTEDFSEVVSRSMEYVATAAVNSGEYTLDRVEKYLTAEAAYTVKPYLRTIYGTYEAADAKTETGKKGVNVTAQDLERDGYTINKALTAQVNAANLTVDEGETFNVYYENSEYPSFETGALSTYSTSTFAERALVDVAPTDMQANTYEVVQTKNDAAPEFNISYSQDKVGTYLVLSAYFTKKSYGGGIGDWACWNKDENKTYPVYAYSNNGNLLPTLESRDLLNKWANVVVQVPNDADGTLRMTLSQEAHNDSWYLGEYTFITEKQFKDNFQQTTVDTDIPDSGVAAYKGSDLTIAPNAGSTITRTYQGIASTDASKYGYQYTMMINDVTTYTAGQYVVARIMGADAGVAMAFYGNPGKTYSNCESLTVTEDGDIAQTPAANTWHYYIWKIATSGDVAQHTHSFRINISAATYISDVYVVENHEAFSAFCETKFPNGFVYGAEAWQKRTDAVPYVSYDEHGNLVYTNKGDDEYWTRGIYLNRSWVEGQYVAIEMYTDSTWDGTNSGTKYGQWWNGPTRTVYDKETKQVITDWSTSGKWCIVVFKMNTMAATNGDYTNNLSFFQGGVAGDTVLIGKTYVFNNEAAFNAWFNA